MFRGRHASSRARARRRHDGLRVGPLQDHRIIVSGDDLVVGVSEKGAA